MYRIADRLNETRILNTIIEYYITQDNIFKPIKRESQNMEANKNEFY